MSTKPFSNKKNLKLRQKTEIDLNFRKPKTGFSVEKTEDLKVSPLLSSDDHIYNSEYPSQPVRATHGGARLKKDRTTHYISTEKAYNIISAVDFAIQIGRP